MLLLVGKNLGERQRELNAKVKVAANNNVDFEQIKHTAVNSDVDNIFKIDLASQYKNIKYMIEVLKSGESLYISRALKCTWMYSEEFDDIINVEYLDTNVIPFMSIKMKKKLLTAISMHVRNYPERAADFYKYCVNRKLNKIALKFIIFTSIDFKLQELKDKSNDAHILSALERENLKSFIGSSFTLADAYIATFSDSSRYAIRTLSYLFSVSEVMFVDLIEKYIDVNPYYFNPCLGVRLSKGIMKRHKYRVIYNSALFIPLLNSKVVLRNSSLNDVKAYLIGLLPDKIKDFWDTNYCTKYKFLIDKIPKEKFEYLKSIFTAKYPGEEFEMTREFYHQQVYEFMTEEEKNIWALKHIESGLEFHGSGNNYIWYKFVKFDKAFQEIKKLVMITTDERKRQDMLYIVIMSAQTQRDIEKLLVYYFDRHINEKPLIKIYFINELLAKFNVYDFDENCWAALNKLFYSLEVYSRTEIHYCIENYKLISFIYSVINNKDIHETVKPLYERSVRSHMSFYLLKQHIIGNLPTEKIEIVIHYLFESCIDEIRKLENVPYDDDVKYEVRKHISFLLDLIYHYDMANNDCPELVMNFIKLDWEEFEEHNLFREKRPELNLMRHLKTDVNLIRENLPLLKQKIQSNFRTFNISLLLKKLKVYFNQDIAKECLQFFKGLLETDNISRKTAQSAIHGILQLEEHNNKVEFMKKYAPTEAKINHSEISANLLRIQEAICAHVLYSRPPLPLDCVLMYIKGDYVHFSLPIFQSYLANLPPRLFMEFVEAILKTPLSIQKHGIRLAFECFNAETLTQLVLQTWKKSKNISLRMIIFKAVLDKVCDDQEAQAVMFQTLKTITVTLHDEDDDEVFKLLHHNRLPRHLTKDYIEITWKVVNSLPHCKVSNVNRKRDVIELINSHVLVDNVNPTFVEGIISEFIDYAFSSLALKMTEISYEDKALLKCKWELTASYIINVKCTEEIGKVELARKILSYYVGPSEIGTSNDQQVLREITMNFVCNLERKSYKTEVKNYESVNVVMKFVLKTLWERMAMYEIYQELLQLKMGIIAREVIDSTVKTFEENSNKDIIEIGENLAKCIGNAVKELVKDKLYLASLSEVLGIAIANAVNKVKTILRFRENERDLNIIVGRELLKFDMFEIYLCILKVIPNTVRSCDDGDDLKLIISTLQQLDNLEITCHLFRKFHLNDDNDDVNDTQSSLTKDHKAEWDRNSQLLNQKQRNWMRSQRFRRRRGAYRHYRPR